VAHVDVKRARTTTPVLLLSHTHSVTRFRL
jgi:hypothetical protein